ncbi:hypothetical protein JZ751_026545 [Albula glossodonta]|uniref:Histone-lysine N-methyltransferase PRDM9-like n=1 Tax=Albula glossodonta TaxID=121402 RepID=A0A8T2PKJ2_9TELE|nr:hypothetical protein JZ751_026545 [Albula glossodonta]
MRRRPLVPRLIAASNCSEKGMMSSPAGEEREIQSFVSNQGKCRPPKSQYNAIEVFPEGSETESSSNEESLESGSEAEEKEEGQSHQSGTGRSKIWKCAGLELSSSTLKCQDGEGEDSVPSPGNNNTSDEEWHPSADTRQTDCEECQSSYPDQCETHGPPSFTSDSLSPLGVPQRALLTLPPGLMVGRSGVPGAGLGVFNQGQSVPVGMHFGPFEGEVTSREKAIESRYSWVICRKKDQYEYIDATRDTHSNWMRYVNCARSEEEQNLVAFQHRGRILYRSLRSIPPGQELLVWYADEYAKGLGSIWDSLWSKKCTTAAVTVEESSQVSSCTKSEFSSNVESCVQRHIKQFHCPLAKDVQQKQTGHSCCECGEFFSLLCNLKKHEQTTHTGKGPHCCTECGQTFSQLIGLKRHKQRHSRKRPYPCTQCDKSFCWFGGLKRHLQSHGMDKSYLCTECGKCFNQSGDLKRHQKIHTGERLYLCTDCGKSFNRLSSLRQHQRVHTGEKPYCCTHCGKCFSYSEQLKVHTRTHTGEKPFLCTGCGESFRQSGDLKRHERKHTGVKPCRCNECGKSFSRPNSLKAHQLLHKGERPHSCPQCDKCFARTGHLRRHLKKMHS